MQDLQAAVAADQVADLQLGRLQQDDLVAPQRRRSAAFSPPGPPRRSARRRWPPAPRRRSGRTEPAEAHVGDHAVDGGVVGLADADVVHAGAGHEVGHRVAALAGRQPAGDELLGAHPDAHRYAVADLCAHSLQPRGMHHGGALDDQADTAGGPLGQIVALAFGQVVGVPVHEARAVTGEDHPVADLQGTDPQRAEQQREPVPAGRVRRGPVAGRGGLRSHPGGPAAAARPRGRACRSPRRGPRRGR